MKKTLGKLESKLLTTLSSQDKSVFSVDDAQKVIGGSLHATHLLLNKLVRKKWLIRLVPGKYLIVPLSAGEEGEYSENWYVVAKNLIEPAPYYISHYSALDVHEMLTQPLFTVYLSSPTRKPSKKVLGAVFRFIYIQPKDLWGIEDAWVTPSQKVKVSDLERTIIDCLDRPKLSGGISEIAKGMWIKRNEIDYQKLTEYAQRFPRKSAIKRLGFLLELYGVGTSDMLLSLKDVLAPGYSLLDPTLEAEGKFVSSWKLRVNLDPEELKEIIKT